MNKSEQLIACLEGEIAKRDARVVGLELEVALRDQALDRHAEYGKELRAELAALKAQEPVAWPEGGSDAVEGAALGAFDSLGQPEHDLESWCAGYAEAVYAHAAPVSEAKAQGVVMPDVNLAAKALCNRHATICGIDADDQWKEYSQDFIEDAETVLANARLNAAPAAPAADAWIVDMYRHLQTVTPYRFKKIQDASITDGGDVMYFHKDRFDAALLADMAAHSAKGVV